MPFSYVAAGTALVGAYESTQNKGGGGGGSGSQGGGLAYGAYMPQAEGGWGQNLNTLTDAANQQRDWAQPNIDLSYYAGQQLQPQWNNYLDASNKAGQQTGALANTVGGYGQQMAGQAQNAFGQQNALQNAGADVYNLARDPQNALYERTQQQLQDQTAATNSMYGLGASGAGAGIQNEAMSNFNIDWQNNQLQRSLQGLQGMSAADQTAMGYGRQGGQDLTAATTFQGMQPGLTQQAAQIPLQAQQQNAANPGNLATQYLSQSQQANAPLYQNQGMIQQYLAGGAGSQQGAAGLAQQQQQFNAQQQQGAMSGLTQGLGQLASLWNSPSGVAGSSGSSGGGGSGGGYQSQYTNPWSVDNSGYSGVALY